MNQSEIARTSAELRRHLSETRRIIADTQRIIQAAKVETGRSMALIAGAQLFLEGCQRDGILWDILRNRVPNQPRPVNDLGGSGQREDQKSTSSSDPLRRVAGGSV
jgi:hypothetical protein